MNLMMPLISVIIPCYNRADLIGLAIDSILHQTYKNHEIIIVNDGSTDDLIEALKPYKDKIKYIEKGKNEGVSVARNSGINISTGEFISFLDSDDLWLPEKSQLHLDLLLNNKDCGMAIGACEYIDVDNRLILKRKLPLDYVSYSDLCIYTAIPGSTSNVLIRKSILDEVGYFDANLHVAEDRELWMRIAHRAPVCTTKNPTVQIRVHDGERKNRSFDLTIKNRIEINNRILSKTLKRKADAWLYFCVFKNSHEYSLVKSLYYLFKSFMLHPFKIHPELRRLGFVVALLRKGRMTP